MRSIFVHFCVTVLSKENRDSGTNHEFAYFGNAKEPSSPIGQLREETACTTTKPGGVTPSV